MSFRTIKNMKKKNFRLSNELILSLIALLGFGACKSNVKQPDSKKIVMEEVECVYGGPPVEIEGNPDIPNPIIIPNPVPIDDPNPDFKSDLRAYYDQIYTLKIKRITVERDGRSFDPGINMSDVICGTGFVLSNGTFVTARQNIEPWVYEGTLKGPWRSLMAQYVALGCDVIIEYDAYSTEGTGHKLSFSNRDFNINRGGDVERLTIEISKDVRLHLRDNGFDATIYEIRKAEFAVFSKKSYSYATLPGIGGAGIPFHAGMSQSMERGTEIQVAGFKNHTNIHNLLSNISYFTSRTSRADNHNGTIVLHDNNSNAGYLGSPAFAKDENGKFFVVGVMVGSLYGEDRIVPIYMCN